MIQTDLSAQAITTQFCKSFREDLCPTKLLTIFQKPNQFNLNSIRDPLELLETLSGINQSYQPREQQAFTETFLHLAKELSQLGIKPLPYCFLLHGTKLEKVDQAIEKMQRNFKVLKSGQNAHEHLIALGFSIPINTPAVVNLGSSFNQTLPKNKLGLNFAEVKGYDLAGGVVLRLYSAAAQHSVQFLAQAGIFLDPDTAQVYILNLQGPTCRELIKNVTSGGQHMGREYARWENQLKASPRQVLLQLIEQIAEFLDCGLVKAIRPEHHPYSYTDHLGFKPTYQAEFVRQGIHGLEGSEPNVYLTKKVA